MRIVYDAEKEQFLVQFLLAGAPAIGGVYRTLYGFPKTAVETLGKRLLTVLQLRSVVTQETE